MDRLLKKIQAARGRIGDTVRQRMLEFEEMHREGNEEWFSEMCFCILTANWNAKGGIRAQKEIGYEGFMFLDKDALAFELKKVGHRFPQSRAGYIVEARKYPDIKDIITSRKDERNARQWLFDHVKGLGRKESSHFLRNVGYKNIAIIDRHVLAVMKDYGLIDRIPKQISKKLYGDCERKLESLAEKANMSLAELDLYLWHMKTGKVLK